MNSIFWRGLGNPSATVLALHCSLAHSGAWRGLSAALGDSIGLIAMDLPSHGRSPAHDPAQDVADQALEWALSGLKRPMHIFGHSFGAYVALRIADAQPDLVQSLCLYEPVFFAAAQKGHKASFNAYCVEMQEIAGLVASGRPEEGARRFVRTWGDGRPWAALPQEMRAGFAAGMPAVLAAQAALIDDDIGLSARLNKIEAPTFVMRGARSHETMAHVQEALIANMPNASDNVLGDAGHMGPITHPKEVAAAFAAHAGF